MNRDVYLNELEALKAEAEKIPNTRLMVMGKLNALFMMNMQYERIMVNRDLPEHPYKLTKEIIADTRTYLNRWQQLNFCEPETPELLTGKSAVMEDKHENLFQNLWVNFNEADYTQRIARFSYRLKINDLQDGFLKGKRIIDVGCGHGNFAHAFLEAGAEYVLGIDYGEKNIDYATKARDRLGVGPDRMEFRLESAYAIQEADNSFDFAVQNGVFHHLDNEHKAYAELARVLKPEGWLWVYTGGKGAISRDLWDVSMYIMRDVPSQFIIWYLSQIGLGVGKRYHLGDALNATYRHETWEGITSRLSDLGFSNFKRLVGGYETDFDHDVIEKDKYGVEKFGGGDLRLLGQLTS